MLAYILAIAIATYSLILFALAFLSPVIHRKDDFLWSGVGLFYALVLWLCAGRITGAVLLGQTAVTLLLFSFGWQTFKLRQAIAYPEQQWEEFSLMQWVQSRLGGVRRKKPTITPTPATSSSEEITPPPTEEKTEPQTDTSDVITQEQEETPETVTQDTTQTASVEDLILDEEVLETPTESESIQIKEKQAPVTPQPRQKKGFSFKNLFGGQKKPKTPSKPEPTKQEKEQTEPEKQPDVPSSTTQITPPTESFSPPETQKESSISGETLETDYQMETFIADEGAETVIEDYRSQETPSDDFSIYQMETFIADEGAETVIESYQVDVTSDNPKDKETEPKEQEKETLSSKPVESKETESEEKEEKLE
ncbi:Ycf66 family protein [Gloeothece citriformis PCC 7424]|uniref:Ycf66 family protein n=1 Tax=Gloeothece citriformis (strain PCC 7424) TaxID=65393 RepID=B7KEA5_GLOC7|nr:Ycf66 family protein [Gloeothece citriformis]ACK73223.1 Ycf66 family protein [Gloeothece citriformis PCC 7424]